MIPISTHKHVSLNLKHLNSEKEFIMYNDRKREREREHKKERGRESARKREGERVQERESEREYARKRERERKKLYYAIKVICFVFVSGIKRTMF